jgi:hypothetical protein
VVRWPALQLDRGARRLGGILRRGVALGDQHVDLLSDHRLTYVPGPKLPIWNLGFFAAVGV